MVRFEYKVLGVNAFDNGVPATHVSSDKLGQVMNLMAEDGWEYQNSIMCPQVSCRDYTYYPLVHLVFRRAKP